MWTLIIIIMAYPNHYGGLGTSVVVPGFSTEQACINAARKIIIPTPPSQRVSQSFTTACVNKDV